MSGLGLLLIGVASAATFDADRIVAAIEEFDVYADQPIPVPTGEDLEELAAGELIRIREVTDPDEPQRVIGLQVLDYTKEQLWVATGDPHYSDVDELAWAKLADLPVPTPGRRWLQFLDVPWPFADRYWVVDSWNSLAMVEATDDRMWENPWRLVDGGPTLARAAVLSGELPEVDEEKLDKAIYTPVNRGAWLAISLDEDTTLFGYHVTTVVGGAIPDNLVARYSMHTLKRVFKGAEDRMDELRTHYDASHEPVIGGNNEPIPPFTTGAGGATAGAAAP